MGEHGTGQTGRHGARRARRRLGALAATVGTVATLAACVPPADPVGPSPIGFTEHVVDAAIPKAAFTIAADVLPGSGKELVVSSFQNSAGGPGTVSIYQRGADLDTWTKSEVVTVADGIRFPSETLAHDVNEDGRTDLIVPGGFFSCELSFAPCGSLQWFEQTETSDWIRHQVVPNGAARFYHRAVPVDVDADGIDDLVTVGETATSAITEWYRGTTTPDRFETTPRFIGFGGGSLPIVVDVDSDDDLDVVSGSLFDTGSSVVWFERIANPSPMAPNGEWARHVLDWSTGGTFQIAAIPDLLGDGVTRFVSTNHVNANYTGGNPPEGVYRHEPGPDLTAQWDATLISQGIRARPGAPGTLAPGYFGWGDIDGDDRIDLAVSGDGDSRLFWLQQQSDGTFETYVIADGMGQAGGAVVDDLDGDGHTDIVFSSYEANRVVVYSAE